MVGRLTTTPLTGLNLAEKRPGDIQFHRGGRGKERRKPTCDSGQSTCGKIYYELARTRSALGSLRWKREIGRTHGPTRIKVFIFLADNIFDGF
jgi:hypothetical protein